MDIRGRQVAGPSPVGSSGAAQGGRDTEEGKQGGQGRRGWWSHERPFWREQKEPTFAHVLKGGARKLSVVPRPLTSCPRLPVPGSGGMGSTSRWPESSVTVFPTSPWAEGQHEGERVTCRLRVVHRDPCSPPLGTVPQVCQGLSWHPCSLSRRISGGPGWQEERGTRAEAFMFPGGEQLSAGVLVPTSPGTPWSREHLSAKPLRARSEIPPPIVLPQPTREAAKKLQGPHPARQRGRAPRAVPSQVLTGSEDRSLHPDAGAALWSTFSVMCAFYREKP